MRRPASARTASLGVTLTKLAIERDVDWLFREQPSEDYGIDAQVELVDGERVEGKLLALQIKGGPSWFTEPGVDGWWYRPDRNHVQYWTNHALPVIVVLVHPETERCHWQLINSRTLVRTSGAGWKLLVPEHQVLDASARPALREAAEGDPYVLRIRELQLARPWMRLLAQGTRLVIEIEEWVNKSSGRGLVTLGVDHEDGEDPSPVAAWTVFVGGASYADVVPRLFAWAAVRPHDETYDRADLDETLASSPGVGQAGLRPYTNDGGEVDRWRLELILNEVGRAFLVVAEFAEQGGRQLTP